MHKNTESFGLNLPKTSSLANFTSKIMILMILIEELNTMSPSTST